MFRKAFLQEDRKNRSTRRRRRRRSSMTAVGVAHSGSRSRVRPLVEPGV